MRADVGPWQRQWRLRTPASPGRFFCGPSEGETVTGTVTEFGAGPTAATAVRALRHDDWPAVKRIYAAGIAGGDATFETETPFWEEWDAGHLDDHRLVALRRGGGGGRAGLLRGAGRGGSAGGGGGSVFRGPPAPGHGGAGAPPPPPPAGGGGGG